MPEYMLLIYEEESSVPRRDEVLPLLVALHRSLREAGVLRGVRALRRTDSATTVRVRARRPRSPTGRSR